MTDTTVVTSSTTAPVAVTPVDAPTNWPAVANTLLHYIAGGVILYIAYQASVAAQLDKSVFGFLLMGAAMAVGFKMSK